MILAIIEGLVLSLAVAGTAFAWGHRLFVDWRDVATMLGQAAAVSLCCITAFYYNDLYDLRVVRSFSLFASRLLQSFGVALILLAVFYTIIPDAGMTEGAFVSGLLVAAGLLVPLRAAGYLIMRRRAFADRVLVLGAGPLARRVIHEIESRPNFRYSVVGVVDDGNGVEPGDMPYPVLGPLERLDKIIDDVKPDRLIVALTERRGRMPLAQLLECGARGILVEDGLRTYEYFTGKLPIESLTPSFLIFSGAFRKSRLQMGLRRASSLLAGTAGLLLTAPIMAVIAAAIALDSRGPVFFIDRRAGRGGRPFNLVKFRTMHPLPPGETVPAAVWDRDDDRRRHARRPLHPQAPPRRAAPVLEHPEGRHGPGRPAAGDPGERADDERADPVLRPAALGAAGTHRLGPDAVRLLGQPRAGHREDPLRSVLHPANVPLAGPSHPGRHREDHAIWPRGQVAAARSPWHSR